MDEFINLQEVDDVDQQGQLLFSDQLQLTQEARTEKHEQEKYKFTLSQRPRVLVRKLTEEARKFEEQASTSKLDLTGTLYKKESKSANWQRYYFSLDPRTIEIYYYKTKEDLAKNKHVNVMRVSWIWAEQASEEDKLVQQQMKLNAKSNSNKMEVCRYRVSVFSPTRTFIISGSSDEDILKLVDNVNKLLKMALSEEETHEKQNAAAKLGPLQHQQLKSEREQYKIIVQSLQQAGIFPDRPTGKRREGYLEMQKTDRTWKKYYFVLFKQSLSYFNLDDKMLPRGVILLESISSIRIPDVKTSSDGTGSSALSNSSSGEENSNPKAETSDKEAKLPKRPFVIHTPLRSYFLRARHEEAMKDWVIHIQQLRGGEAIASQIVAENVVRNVEEIQGEPVTGSKIITYTVNGKAKSFKMKKESVTIGRTSKADICLTDVKVSRNHARIEMQSNGVPVFYDVGSSTGSSVNGKKVIKTALKPGDVIQLGHTTLVFQVEPKKK